MIKIVEIAYGVTDKILRESCDKAQKEHDEKVLNNFINILSHDLAMRIEKNG